MTTQVNRDGYLADFSLPGEGYRTYACADLPSLMSLVERKTGRKWDSLVLDDRGLPHLQGHRIDRDGIGLTVADGLHILDTREAAA